MQVDKQIIVGERFAIATDNVQWVLQRSTGKQWRAIGFVRSTKDALARCMVEAGATQAEIDTLLADLPPHFPGWEASHDAKTGLPLPPAMWRVRMRDGSLSDILNLSRAKDLARSGGGTVVAAAFKHLAAAE